MEDRKLLNCDAILNGPIGGIRAARTYLLALRDLIGATGTHWGSGPNRARLIEREKLTKLSDALQSFGEGVLEPEVRNYRSLRDQNGCVHLSTGVVTVWLYMLSEGIDRPMPEVKYKECDVASSVNAGSSTTMMTGTARFSEEYGRRRAARNLHRGCNKAGVPFV